jgi:hypothetical protein
MDNASQYRITDHQRRRGEVCCDEPACRRAAAEDAVPKRQSPQCWRPLNAWADKPPTLQDT